MRYTFPKLLFVLLVSPLIFSCSESDPGLVNIRAGVMKSAIRAAAAVGGTDYDGLYLGPPTEVSCKGLRDDLAVDTFHVSGNQKSFISSTDKAILLIVNGNQNVAHIEVASEKAARVICVRANGHMSEVKLVLNGRVEKLIYEGMGDQSRGEIEVGEEGAIGQLFAHLTGHESGLRVTGEGEFDCPEAVLHGDDPRFECE